MITMTDLIVAGLVAAVPGVIVGGWALFKANATRTPAKWDDAVVSAIEGIATRAAGRKRK